MKAGLCGEKDGCPLYLASFENASNETDVYQLLLNHSNSMVYISDAHTYEMLYANKPARDYHGEADNSYVGRKCYEYIRGESAPCSWCFLQKIKTHADGAGRQSAPRSYLRCFPRHQGASQCGWRDAAFPIQV